MAMLFFPFRRWALQRCDDNIIAAILELKWNEFVLRDKVDLSPFLPPQISDVDMVFGKSALILVNVAVVLQ